MQNPEIEIVFMPGCFNDWDGTEEELQEMLAEVRQMAADGTLFLKAEPVSEEEMKIINDRIERRSIQ